MTSYRYSIGQLVEYTSPVDRLNAQGRYKVIGYLPPEAGECRYRIKRDSEPFERTAGESQLEMVQ